MKALTKEQIDAVNYVANGGKSWGNQIRSRLACARRKIGARTTAELVALCIDIKVIPPPPPPFEFSIGIVAPTALHVRIVAQLSIGFDYGIISIIEKKTATSIRNIVVRMCRSLASMMIESDLETTTKEHLVALCIPEIENIGKVLLKRA